MLKNKSKLVFLSSDNIAIPCLEAVLNEYDILVITKSDKQQKRSQQKKANHMATYCEDNNIDVLKIDKLDSETIKQLKKFNADLAVCFSFGLIIPDEVLNLYPNKLINIHPSKLPKYRGPSPIQAALLNDDKQTAITFMIMNAKMDEGNIIKQFNLNIDSNDTYTTLSDKVAKLSAEHIISILHSRLNSEPQSNDAIYCKMINKQDGLIDINENSQTIYNKYRAYYEWPKIYGFWLDKKIIISNIEHYPKLNKAKAGTIYKDDDNIYLQTGDGSLKLNKIQLEGKKNMPIKAFINGHADFIKSTLSFSQ